MKIPFAKWSSEQVCDWLEEIGLSQYSVLARHWVSGGQSLLSATPHDLERVAARAHTDKEALQTLDWWLRPAGCQLMIHFHSVQT